jgi:hypothetical protein
MNKVFGRLLVVGVATAGLATAGFAYADGFGHANGHQIKAAIAPNAAALKSDYGAVKTARQSLENDLIAGNSNAVQTDVQALETAQSNLLLEKVTVAQAILANLSSAQRTQVGSFVSAYRAMELQNRQNRETLFQQYGIGWGANGSPETSSTPAE